MAVGRIEDQQRQTGRAIVVWTADDRIADAGAGQTRGRQRSNVVASPGPLGVITGIPERRQRGVGAPPDTISPCGVSAGGVCARKPRELTTSLSRRRR